MPPTVPSTPGRSRQNSLQSILRGPVGPLTGSPRSPAAAIKPPSLPTVSENKHKIFRHRNGAKLHTFPREDVPWPFQFNRETLEQSVMDQLLVRRVRDSQIFTDFGDKPPRRCLDLGTALGGWITDTARQFPECTFVGFDIMDIQIPLDYVDPSIASRIEWVHGNFLISPLPFKDNEFDYIHVCGIALGVPEDKWDMLFEELHRILCPGGFIELIQQDARFPILPRWFTGPLHAHLEHRTVDLPDGARPAFIPSSEVSPRLPHVYALLEELYYSVFERRWINPTPSSILPGYFSSTFRQVISPPILRFPMPPIAPLIPQSVSTSTTSSPLISPSTFLPTSETTSDPFDPWTYFIPNSDTGAASLMTASSATIADTDSVKSDTTLMTSILQELDIQFPEQRYDLDRELKPYSRGLTPPLERAQSVSGRIPPSPPSLSYCEPITSRHRTRSNASSFRRSVAVLCPTETTQLGGVAALDLFRVERLLAMGDDSLFMHLYQAAHYVYALTEAMWDELKERVELNDPKLSAYGWGTDDYSLEPSRAKFDGLMAQYKGDMQHRLSLWHSCTKHGWILPKRQPLSKAELVQEDRLRQAILEARKNATEQEFNTPVRSIRLLIGVKQT